MTVLTVLFNDPACPWGYSANPQFRVLEWRYGAQLDWRLVLIGLRDEIDESARARFDPAQIVGRWGVFRQRFGMPFALAPKERPAASGRACRAIVSARLRHPGSERRVLRALQIANFTTPLVLDDDDHLRAALRHLEGIDADAVVAGIDDPEVTSAYARDKAEARSAAGSPTEMQGKAASWDGPARYTAPSVIFERDGQRLVAGGWQPSLSYDTCIANLDPTLERRPAPDDPAPLLEYFPDGLTTAEVAMLMATGPAEVPDIDAAELALAGLVAAGAATREAAGHDAVWRSVAARGRAAQP